MRRRYVVALVLAVAACGSTPNSGVPTTSQPVLDVEGASPVSSTQSPQPPATTTTEAPPPTTTTRVPPATTTTAPQDVTPPILEIATPEDGAVVTERQILFTGRTEPGCTVASGPYEAEVDDEGNWSIVLILNPGGNTARLHATDDAGNTTEAAVMVTLDTGETALSAGALGDVAFGTSQVETLAWLETRFGAPDSELEEAGFLGILWIHWDAAGLSAAFTSAATGYRADGVVHLAGWIVSAGSGAAGLAHEGGARVGATASELLDAYGSNLFVPESFDECTGDWFVVIGSGDNRIYVTLDSPPSEPTSTVLAMRAGISHGC